ncbi:MAG: TylF/MycF/NovP-related O-methyltransferase [Verrucomicrobiia bacterium]
MIKRKLTTIYRILYSSIFGTSPGYPVLIPTDTCGVEILADREFQNSCREVRPFTVLDTPRLANLWSLCRMTSWEGSILEVGSFRGGGALHLSNSNPKRKIIICDSFQGFEKLDTKVDKNFTYEMFKNTTHKAVDQLFSERKRNYAILAGYFPAICKEKNFDLGRLSFVHLDVDAYKPTIESLDYLEPFMMPRSLIVLDDFNRKAEGVMRAVSEFVARNPTWVAFPLFPSQGLMVHKSWFDSST